MAIFTIADLHLSFAAKKPMDVFGARWNGYTEKLAAAWRETVTDTDTVVIPGDISWGMRLPEALPDLVWLDRLPGKKLIGRGNHDYWWDTAAKMRRAFAEVGITTIDFLHNNAYLVEGEVLCGTRGWFSDGKTAPRDGDFAKISAREAIRLEAGLQAGEALARANGITVPPIVFLHFPPILGDAATPELLAVLANHGVRRCYFGHIHGMYRLPPTFVHGEMECTLISADFLDFTPYRIAPSQRER